MTKQVDVVQLVDAATGSTAKVHVQRGFNCFAFRARDAWGEHEVLWADPHFEMGQGRPSGSGIPLLFPFPGRIKEAAFLWRGKKFHLEPNDGRGNAIHGFVLTRPWRIVEREAHRVVGEFQASVDDPSLLAFWPADFCIRATYRLDGTTLEGHYLINNPDSEPLPFGFGTHPYFRLPLGGRSAGACLVALPVHEEWELTELVPTGIRFPLRDYFMFHQGLEFAGMQFDSVFSGLVFDESGWCHTIITDPDSGRRVIQSFDRNFTACVVYTPPHRQAVCIEPYTCVPNAIRLYSAGIPSGIRILAPGEEASMAVRITVATSS